MAEEEAEEGSEEELLPSIWECWGDPKRLKLSDVIATRVKCNGYGQAAVIMTPLYHRHDRTHVAGITLSQHGERAVESNYAAGGLLFGLTATKNWKCRSSIMEVPHSWIFDAYGCLWIYPELPDNSDLLDVCFAERTEHKLCNWNSYAFLKNEDLIGLRVDHEGTLEVLKNGECIGSFMINVPTESNFIVELLGRTESVALRRPSVFNVSGIAEVNR
eukprot:GEMP01078782.1.p1 GENE.GEMP01078782.1~~GEMP01078782.1.p1  ORF type:complete len:217 (+),score=38.14 GEMP01078782.1:76-726(+)